MANNRVIGVKKSEFLTDNTIPDTATLDYVDTGVNKKIAFVDFLPLLGTTGSLVQVGDSGGTPVLDTQGTINGIRNLVSGAGVAVSLTGQNGIQFDSAFTFDTTGAQLVDNAAAATLAFRSIIGGTGITVTGTTGDITVDVDDSDLLPDNIVIVNAASDFPTPVSGEITLAVDTAYLIGGVITIADTIVPSSKSAITGHINLNSELNYTGTGSMFKGRNEGISINNVTLRCATGTLHDWLDTTPVHDSVVEFSNVIVAECKNVGLSTDIKQIRYFACVFSDIKTTGHTFAGDIEQIFSVDTDFVNNSATPVYDLGTVTADLIWVIDYQVELVNASGSWFSGLANSANINTGGLGQLIVGLNIGTGTDLIGITTTDTLWNFRDINRIADTQPDALLNFKGNATATVIAASSTDGTNAVLVAGTWVEQRISQFTTTAAGRVTYKGGKDLTAPIDVIATLDTPTADTVALYIALNGTPIAATGISQLLEAADKGTVSTMWQLTLSTNDFIEVFVENQTDATDITVIDIIFRIR